MRLGASQQKAIREEVERAFGAAAVVRLFGSRAVDTARGGDIDLLVESPVSVPDPAWAVASLEARLMRRLDGRKVDVLLMAPNVALQPVHRIAFREGLSL